MAITDGLLIFVGSLATLCSVGAVYVNFPDSTMNVFLSVLSSVLWGTFGIASYDVIGGQGTAIRVDYLVFLGIGLAALMFIHAIYEFFFAFRSEFSNESVLD